MSPVHRVLVRARRLVARHPWVYWLAIAAVAVALAASVLARIDQVAAARDSWGDTRLVWVTTDAMEPGEPIVAERREVPEAVVPDGAVGDVTGRLTRQRIGSGRIVTETDVVVDAGPRSLVPEGWLAVPIVESPRSGASIGDRVRLASDGFVISSDALVVAVIDDVTLVAVPADEAPTVAAAGAASGLTVLLRP
jgi:hypothetical protein